MSWNSYMSSGGIRSKTFTDYDTARNHFETIKPIRGRNPELRPLGSNRAYTHCKIELDELTWGVSATLYGTQCVTIFPDKTIKINRDSWLTPSTANFIDAILPSKFGTVYLRRSRLIYKNHAGQEYDVPQAGLMLQVSDDWSTAEVKVDTNNIPVQYEYKADRKVLNSIRKKIKPILDTINVMSSMSTEYTIHEIAEYFPNVIERYVEEINEHNRKLKLKEEGDKDYENYYGYFYGAHALRIIVNNKVGLPAMSLLSEMGARYKKHHDNRTHLHKNYLVDRGYTDAYVNAVNSVFTMSEPNKAVDAESVRKLMLSVVTNGNNYGTELRGDTGMTSDTTVDTLFGKVSVKNLMWQMSGSAIENYLIDVIKYVYADLIFKQVEVPYGTLPSVANDKYVFCNKYLDEQEDIVTRRYDVQ